MAPKSPCHHKVIGESYDRGGIMGADRDSYIKVMGVLIGSYLLGVKNPVLVPLRVFSFKKSTVLAYAVHFRVLI